MKYLRIYTDYPQQVPNYLLLALTKNGLILYDLDPFDVILEDFSWTKLEVLENGLIIETFTKNN